MNERDSPKNMRWWKNIILFGIFIAFLRYWLTTKSYLFERNVIFEIGTRHVGM